LHELADQKGKKTEISIDNVKIDKLTKDYLAEVKKSDSDPEAVKWQVLLYLYKLKQKGVLKKGKIEFIEKRKQSKKVHFVELDEANEKELLEVLEKISDLIDLPKPPEAKFERHCRKCAYYEYCFI
jgi:CRISPR-associated exonuclease Cas4